MQCCRAQNRHHKHEVDGVAFLFFSLALLPSPCGPHKHIISIAVSTVQLNGFCIGCCCRLCWRAAIALFSSLEARLHVLHNTSNDKQYITLPISMEVLHNTLSIKCYVTLLLTSQVLCIACHCECCVTLPLTCQVLCIACHWECYITLTLILTQCSPAPPLTLHVI